MRTSLEVLRIKMRTSLSKKYMYSADSHAQEVVMSKGAEKSTGEEREA